MKADRAALRLGGRFKDDGLTLIEVLVALAVVCVGLLGIGALQAAAVRGSREARMRTEAGALAARTLERLRLLPFDHPDLAAGPEPHRFRPNSSSAFAVQWAVTDGQPVAGAKTVHVQVSIPGAADGRPVRLQTVVADHAR